LKVIIVDSSTSAIDGKLRNEMLDWARSLGVDTKVAKAQFAIAGNADGRCWAHFSMKRQRDGHDYVLPDTNRVATDYGSFVVEVAQGSWPRWFGDPEDVPDVPVPALLEIVDAVKAASDHLAWRAKRIDA
jgi:hypothetical protein